MLAQRDVGASQSANDDPVWSSAVVDDVVLGHPCQVFASRRHHVADLLLDGRRFSDRDYLRSGSRRLTFADHERAVAGTGAMLRALGVMPGDRVLLHAANSIEWVVAFWAILDVGAVIVLGNTWWSATELDHAVAETDPTLVVSDVPIAGSAVSRPACLLVHDIREGMHASAERAPRDGCAEDDPAVVLYTSGTTGDPKGATLSHRGIIATLQALAVVTRRLGSAAPDIAHRGGRALLSLPLFHIGGLQQVITPMMTGGTLVFAERKFDPERIVRLLDDERVTVWSAVPTMVRRVIDHLDASGHGPMMGLRTVGMGGSPVDDRLRRDVAAWFPRLRSGAAVTYGLSEAGGVVTTGVGPDVACRPGSVGRPLPCTTIRIDAADASGVGEVLVRSPSVMLGYWKDGAPDMASGAPVSADRWLATGDLGRIDDDDHLIIVGRSKDVVIRGGENIATPHVENRLLEHAAVREAAVVGLPHPELGEELGAVVVLHDGADATIDELRRFCRSELAYFEVPTRWWFVDGPLPQNAIGKVVKHALRSAWPTAEDGRDEELGDADRR